MRGWVKWSLIAVVAVVVAVPAATFVYLNFIEDDAPERLSLDAGEPAGDEGDGTTTVPATAGSVEGEWRVGAGSQAGYRVKEVLFGQDNEAVGRTDEVEGSMTVDGSTVTATEIVVDLASVTSDQSRRDGQFRGRIMDVERFPTATFRLTAPVALPDETAGGATVAVPVTGELTLRGTTKTVTADLQARRAGDRIEVSSAIPIVFEEWGIPNPSFGPVSTEDNGEIEFLVVFERAA